MKYIFDLDDMDDSHNCLPQLLELKKILPNLKVTLFTIPMRTSFELLDELKKHNWIQLAVHGFRHEDNYEFAHKNYKQVDYLLGNLQVLKKYFQLGFKAPGWMINEDTMRWLKNHNWWVAVQWSDGRWNGDVNAPFQPKVIPGLKFYAFREISGDFRAIHGHTWNTCGNGILELWPELTALPKDSEFVFINDYVNENKK